MPTTTSFRRVGDEDADLQNENTTVFTWEAFTSQLFTTTDQPFDSHQEYNELQTDQNPLLYVVSAAAVFLAYVLHFGFAPALFLGRLAICCSLRRWRRWRSRPRRSASGSLPWRRCYP